MTLINGKKGPRRPPLLRYQSTGGPKGGAKKPQKGSKKKSEKGV